MKSALIILALLGLAAAYNPPAQCFTKSTKCCFKFFPCGYVVKTDTIKKRCDFKKCENVCAPKCQIVCKIVKERKGKKVCKPKKVKKCTWVKNKWGIKIPKCKYVVKGEKCKIVYVLVPVRKCEKVCKTVCKKVCYNIHAICTYTRTIKYAKFCAKVKCGKEIITGNNKPPAHYVSPKGKVVKVSKPVRKIIGKKPY